MDQVIDFRPKVVHLKLYEGSTYTLQIHVLNSEGGNMDLSAVPMLMQIRHKPTDPDKVKELTNGNGLTGSVASMIEATLSVDFPSGVYVSDLFMTISGEPTPVVKFIITVDSNVSR